MPGMASHPMRNSMLISVAFIVLLVSPLSFGFVFIKQWSIKRIHTSCSPFTSLRYVCSNSIQRLHQQQSDEHDQGSAFHNTEVLERSEEEAGDDFPEVESLAEVDPVAQATIDQEKRLAEELQHLETVLKSERVSLIKVRDNLSESGKNGFFIVQAQVNDFTRRKDKEQKERVARNKKEFVEKMLPVVDTFRSAPLLAPAVSEKEKNMHKSYGSLLSNILAVFGKYGYSEYHAAPGEALNPQLHQVCEVRECSALEELDDVTFNMLKEGAVLETLRAGMRDSEGIVLRKALVAVCEKSETTESPPATGDLPDHVHSIDNLNVSVDDLDFYEDDHEGYDSEDDE